METLGSKPSSRRSGYSQGNIVQFSLEMRRSAAPSQIGSLKRPHHVTAHSSAVRSDADVVSLLKKRASCPTEIGASPRSEQVIENDKSPQRPDLKPHQSLKEQRPGFKPHQSLKDQRLGFKPHQNIKSTVVLQDQSNAEERFFNVVWGKLSKKKHKTWDGDAVMIVSGRSVRLIDLDGKEIGRGSGYSLSSLASLSDGDTLTVGGKAIEVCSTISVEDYRSGQCFNGCSSASSAPVKAGLLSRPVLSGFKPVKKPQRTEGMENNQEMRPLYDVNAADTILLPRPPPAHILKHNKNDLPIVDVVVDPYIAKQLRPHQQEGVIFLYECVMGYRNFGKGAGAILADSMGLGKTLQCISLVWTLIRQGVYGGKPIVKRCLIVTPGSLVKNWSREFSKWLGDHRLPVFYGGVDSRVEDYAKIPTQPVLVLSYEMFLRHSAVLSSLSFDLLICDEGHRLKNLDSKTTSILHSLATQRRVILTGTPLQNDMEELYSLAEFSNPGILGSVPSFRRIYADAILAGRQPGASASEQELGECRARELSRITNSFVLRRTQEVNTKYLPPKVESVLFCRPSDLQLNLYHQALHSKTVTKYLQEALGGILGNSADHLACIMVLKKLCNDPSLLWRDQGDPNGDSSNGTSLSNFISELSPHFPENYDPNSFEQIHSGKLWVVGQMLVALFSNSSTDKIVLVSNYTQTLDVLQKLCSFLDLGCLRLDGKTPTQQRQKLVEHFNTRGHPDRVLLLSSKAGGTGLNLIGAAYLVLFDVDWNPAHEIQAMARIWRDGQKRTVHVYRLLTTGTIEEKIYQRQITKQGLSGQVVDSRACGFTFSVAELKDLFRVHEDTACLTHDLLKCSCQTTEGNTDSVDRSNEEKKLDFRPGQLGGDEETSLKSSILDMAELMAWRHFDPQSESWQTDVSDPLILAAESNLSFVFQHHVSSGDSIDFSQSSLE